MSTSEMAEKQTYVEETTLMEEGLEGGLISVAYHEERRFEVYTKIEGACCISTIISDENTVASFMQCVPSAEKATGEQGERIFMELQHEDVLRRVLAGDYAFESPSDPSLSALFI